MSDRGYSYKMRVGTTYTLEVERGDTSVETTKAVRESSYVPTRGIKREQYHHVVVENYNTRAGTYTLRRLVRSGLQLKDGQHTVLR